MDQQTYQALAEEMNQQGVALIAVSKTKPIAAIEQLYAWGQRDFGENKVQEMCTKYEQMAKDIHWHQIGHLQTNKVKYIIPFVALIHSVDSFKLLMEIEKQAAKIERLVPILLQIHIATEETKFGLNKTELVEILEYASANNSFLKHVQIRGLMGMSSLTENTAQIRAEFKGLKDLFTFCQNSYFVNKPSFNILSMGMSGDYPVAIQEGSNMVRIGSLLFGERH
jgi:pyridoxal phosphate enzyme (YggS family)